MYINEGGCDVKKYISIFASGLLMIGLVWGLSFGPVASATVPGINELMNKDASGVYGNGGSDDGGYSYLSGDGR